MATESPRRNRRTSNLTPSVLFESPPSTASSTSTITQGTEIPEFMLWVKEEPFLFGILSPHPCSKLGINVLRKVAEYCRDKDGYYPKMNLLQWGHISKYKLQLPTDLSWCLLRVFDIISKPLESSRSGQEEARDSWDKRCEEIRMCATDDFDEVTVDTLKFLVFLYIQHYIRLHKKYLNRPLSSDDTWPSTMANGVPASVKGRNPQAAHGLISSPAGVSSLKKKAVPEQIHIEFLISNLEEIVNYLMLTIKDLPVEQGRIPVDLVRALTFILGAASVNPHDREFKSLEECFMVLPEAAEAVDLKNETVDKIKFIKWVKANLKLNPWGPSSAPISQQKVDCVTGIWEKTKAYEGNRIYWNTQSYPKGWYLISSVENQVLNLDSVQPLSSIRIHRCNNSYIYVPGVFTSIIVEKCRNSTIYLGPAGKVIKFNECANILVTAVGRLVVLCDTYKSTFNLLTPCQPIICGNQNRRVILGPYNSFYPKLEEHMAMVGLGISVQKWNKPIELGPNGFPLSKEQVPSYSLLRTEKFFNVVFSFEMDGSTTKNPVELPQNYAKRLQQIQSKLNMFKEEVLSMDYTEEETFQLNVMLKARFRTWLKSKGHMNELKGLRSIQISRRMGSSVPLLDSQKKSRSSSSSRLDGISMNKNNSNGPPSMTSVRGNGDLYSNGKESQASSVSIVSTIGSTSSCGIDRPGTVSESDNDDVFVFEGDDFNHLDSVFFSEGEETDGFVNSFVDDGSNESWEDVGHNVNGDVARESNHKVDDGLNWNAI